MAAVPEDIGCSNEQCVEAPKRVREIPPEKRGWIKKIDPGEEGKAGPDAHLACADIICAVRSRSLRIQTRICG